MFLSLGVAAALATGACAGPRRPPESAATARLKDSAPEKVAAQRAAAPGLALETEDQRWGIVAARERRQALDANVETRTKDAKKGRPSGTGTVDLAPAKPNP